MQVKTFGAVSLDLWHTIPLMRNEDDATNSAASLVSEDYLRWYYDTGVWNHTTFLGILCLKSVSDMWNYQEILFDLKPGLVVEFGAFNGGSALYFSTIARLIRPEALVLSVDADLSFIAPRARNDRAIRFFESSSTDPRVASEIRRLRLALPGPIFCILDSDHSKKHVLAELELLKDITRPGDYVVVEDGIINGHPVLPDWGEGPWEALAEYFDLYPDDYVRDETREAKFGWTFAAKGFLIRR
jgi:cephalosporin hydroxylase